MIITLVVEKNAFFSPKIAKNLRKLWSQHRPLEWRRFIQEVSNGETHVFILASFCWNVSRYRVVENAFLRQLFNKTSDSGSSDMGDFCFCSYGRWVSSSWWNAGKICYIYNYSSVTGLQLFLLFKSLLKNTPYIWSTIYFYDILITTKKIVYV
jgi:hypothetical protein